MTSSLTTHFDGDLRCAGTVIGEQRTPQLAVLLPQPIRDGQVAAMVNQHQLERLPGASEQPAQQPTPTWSNMVKLGVYQLLVMQTVQQLLVKTDTTGFMYKHVCMDMK